MTLSTEILVYFSIEIYTFGLFENPEGKTKKQALSIEQVNVLERYSILPKDLTLKTFHALNVFLFQIYAAGLRVGDAMFLRWGDVSGVGINAYVRKSEKYTMIPLQGSTKVINILRYYMPTVYKLAYLKKFSDPVMENTLTPDEAEQLRKLIQMNYEVEADGSYIEHPRLDFMFNDDFRLNNLLALYSEISMSDFKKIHIFSFIQADTTKMNEFELYNEIGNATTKVNLQLKNLMPLMRTNVSLSSHISRHTFANLARKVEDVQVVSQMLVHASVAETEAYLKEIEIPELLAAKSRVANSF